MSATNRSNVRKESDYYPTPDDLADRIVQKCAGGSLVKSVLEPSAGSGAFVRACKMYFPKATIDAVEPSAQHWGTLIDLGVTVGQHSLEQHAHSYGERRFDLIVGNPPYSLAEEHVRLCVGLLAPGGSLVFLLRLAFLESRKRRALFCELPPSEVTVLSERPSFTGNGKTDATAYAVFRWTSGHQEPTSLGWM